MSCTDELIQRVCAAGGKPGSHQLPLRQPPLVLAPLVLAPLLLAPLPVAVQLPSGRASSTASGSGPAVPPALERGA